MSAAEPKPKILSETISQLVRKLEDSLPSDGEVQVGQILRQLGVYGFVFFLLLLALLNVAIFMLPGLSILFGVPMVILAVQMLLGIRAPIFPAFVLKKTIRGEMLHLGLDLSIQGLEKVEPYIKPRLKFLTDPAVIRVHSFTALVLAFMVAVPVPFLNLPPTFGMILLAIGLMQRDGFFILGAYAFTAWSVMLYESIGQAAQGLVG